MEEEVSGLTREEKQWLAWFLVTLGTFAYLEARAVKARNGRGTLTAATRRVLGLYPPKPWRLFGAAGFTAFFAWLTAHIITGDFVPSRFKTGYGEDGGCSRKGGNRE